jgi:PAS domain S-box-containing protein
MERLEKKAQSMEKRLASITQLSADAILSLDAAGQIVSWNPGAEELFGFLENEALGKPFVSLVGGGKAAQAEVHWIEECVRREGYLHGHESICYDAQEKAVHVELTAIPLRDENREFFGLFLILRDITSRKQREEEIKRLNQSLNEQVAERTRELDEKISQLARVNADCRNLTRLERSLFRWSPTSAFPIDQHERRWSTFEPVVCHKTPPAHGCWKFLASNHPPGTAW